VVQATGSFTACVSDWGAYDMVGNLQEWVADWVPASTTCPGWGLFSDDRMCLSGASTTARAPGALLRGGAYSSGATTGAFAVNGTTDPPDDEPYIGFRGAR
jgi:formylglycine-generating enzyme required for sulfatase activity